MTVAGARDGKLKESTIFSLWREARRDGEMKERWD